MTCMTCDGNLRSLIEAASRFPIQSPVSPNVRASECGYTWLHPPISSSPSLTHHLHLRSCTSHGHGRIYPSRCRNHQEMFLCPSFIPRIVRGAGGPGPVINRRSGHGWEGEGGYRPVGACSIDLLKCQQGFKLE